VPRLDWKIDGTAVLTLIITAAGLAAQWGVNSVRISALEARMDRVSQAIEQLTPAVTKIQTQLEEREKIAERRR